MVKSSRPSKNLPPPYVHYRLPEDQGDGWHLLRRMAKGTEDNFMLEGKMQKGEINVAEGFGVTIKYITGPGPCACVPIPFLCGTWDTHIYGGHA